MTVRHRCKDQKDRSDSRNFLNGIINIRRASFFCELERDVMTFSYKLAGNSLARIG